MDQLQDQATQGHSAPWAKSGNFHPVIDTVPAAAIASFLNHYKKQYPQAIIYESKSHSVLLVDGHHASEEFLLELGRLREITFRNIGEGTGESCDIDKHDLTYQHLIVWNKPQQWISGSYRVTFSPPLCPTQLYSHQSLSFKQEFFQRIGNCIEVGRSFVRKEARGTSVLFHLWRGMALILHRNRNYQSLFGLVSISQKYSERSRHLIARYLLKNHGDTSHLEQFIQPQFPYHFSSSFSEAEIEDILGTIHDIEDLSKMVSFLEGDKGPNSIPMLITRYVSLGSRYVAFMLDPSFQNTLDGLIVVNIKSIPYTEYSRFIDDAKTNEILGHP